MTIGLLYWICFILCIVLGAYTNRASIAGGNYGVLGGGLLLLIMLFLLGWYCFGFVVQGGPHGSPQ